MTAQRGKPKRCVWDELSAEERHLAPFIRCKFPVGTSNDVVASGIRMLRVFEADRCT